MIRKILKSLDVAVTRYKTLESLLYAQRELSRTARFHLFCQQLSFSALRESLCIYPYSRGEIFQDIFALLMLEGREGGFFVEFGATDGIHGSNTYLMEERLGWSGILAEPARCWHKKLQKNRNSVISHKCVWSKGKEKLLFHETRDTGLSTLANFITTNKAPGRNQAAGIYEVETITLQQLLEENNAPHVIDFLSIDTEGSEFNILSTFNFDKYRPLVVTAEHNFRPERARLIELMSLNGYLQAPTTISGFDDWFVCNSLAKKLNQIFLQEREL